MASRARLGSFADSSLSRPTTIETIHRSRSRPRERRDDLVACEQPLQIRVDGRVLATIMRTPGHDLELVSGLLFAEGIIRSPRDVSALAHCREVPAETSADLRSEVRENVVLVKLRAGAAFDARKFRRGLLTSSACGVCGRATIDELATLAPPVASELCIEPALLIDLPRRLRRAQSGFAATGGLHAAALFDGAGRLLVVREDIGRHNAVDKVIGAALRHDLTPLHRCILQVSGRVSFEIVQKARVAGVPIVAAVSAPTSLAIELAKAGGQTLVAFVREGRLNVYCGARRLRSTATARARSATVRETAATNGRPHRSAPRRQSGSRDRGGASA